MHKLVVGCCSVFFFLFSLSLSLILARSFFVINAGALCKLLSAVFHLLLTSGDNREGYLDTQNRNRVLKQVSLFSLTFTKKAEKKRKKMRDRLRINQQHSNSNSYTLLLHSLTCSPPAMLFFSLSSLSLFR